jgi:hypothetical protein
LPSFDRRFARETAASADNKTTTAVAKTAGVNRGAIERQKKLRDERPDLAEKVRQGKMKPTEALRTVKRDAIIDKARGARRRRRLQRSSR